MIVRAYNSRSASAHSKELKRWRSSCPCDGHILVAHPRVLDVMLVVVELAVMTILVLFVIDVENADSSS